jgi:hypothetical protein
MKYSLLLCSAVFITLLGQTPLHAQARQLVAMATGTVTNHLDGEPIKANFEMWGIPGATYSIMNILPDDKDKGYGQILIISAGKLEARGKFTPCDGGRCPSTLRGNGAETEIMGVCSNQANPAEGTFSIFITDIKNR